MAWSGLSLYCVGIWQAVMLSAHRVYVQTKIRNFLNERVDLSTNQARQSLQCSVLLLDL